MSETQSSENEVKAHLWVAETGEDEDGRIDFELIHRDMRVLIWFDDEGECGWAVVSKSGITGSGYLPEEFLSQLRTWLEKYRS